MSGSSSFNRFCCFCCCFWPSLVRDFNNNKNGTHTHNIEQLTRQANGGSKIIQIVFSTLLILPTDCHFAWASLLPWQLLIAFSFIFMPFRWPLSN